MKDRPTVAIWIFRGAFVMVIGALIYGYVANELQRKGINNVKDSIVDMDDLKDENIVSVLGIADSVDNVVVATRALNDTLVALEPEIGPLPADVEAAIALVLGDFGSATTSIRDAVDNLDSIPISDVVDVIEDVEMYRYYVMQGLLLFITLPFGFLFLAHIFNCRRVIWNITWIGILCSTVAWLLSALEASACVVLSDVCIEPSELLLEQAESIDPVVFNFTEFYVVCENITNPLDEQLDTARDVVNDTQSQITELEDFVASVEGSISPADFALLEAQLANVTTETDNIVDTVEFLLDTLFLCNRIHNNYVGAVDGVCNSLLPGLFGLVTVQTCVAILTWVAMYCAIKIYRYLLDQHKLKKLDESPGPVCNPYPSYPPQETPKEA